LKNLASVFDPLIGTLQPQSNGPLYSNTVIGTLVMDEYAVTFGTARRGLGVCYGAAKKSFLTGGQFQVPSSRIAECTKLKLSFSVLF